ncbi:MAG: cobalamin B12-binding domain-containing protein, partial [Thermoanaerobacteraceae bacterium]|nr:cobalamin B12-binding domain-containing protein [Thermoanaerobacteraceae bacterium]
TDSEIVALSAMMTTTMVGMKDVIKAIKEKNPRAKIMIGGAPVTDEIADRFGADGYAKDASNALKEAINMIASLREL